MTSMAVIVPSRGRPDAAVELATQFAFTKATSRLVFAIDDDDPMGDQYIRALNVYPYTTVTRLDSRTMVEALNKAALSLADEHEFLAFMGDDHRPRTEHWDAMYAAALQFGAGVRMVYGDDLVQGRNLPTQIAMRSDVVRTLGHMAPTALTHLYVDNYWKDLGLATRSIRYLPQVVVEHVHPVTGKVPWDDGHTRVNDPAMYTRDADAYHTYVASGAFAEDVKKVKALP